MTTESRNPDLIARALAANAQLGEALAALISITAIIRATLSTAVEPPVKPPLNEHQTREEALAAHRRAHRSGYPPKIEGDPELEPFIPARVDTLTFGQITDAIKANFPPGMSDAALCIAGGGSGRRAAKTSTGCNRQQSANPVFDGPLSDLMKLYCQTF